MAIARKNEFPESDIQLAQIFKALSHPGRIAILKILAKKQTCICGDLVEDLPLAQSTVSQHLKTLLDANLIQGRIDGPRSCYCINEKTWAEAEKLFKRFSKQVESCGNRGC